MLSGDVNVDGVDSLHGPYSSGGSGVTEEDSESAWGNLAGAQPRRLREACVGDYDTGGLADSDLDPTTTCLEKLNNPDSGLGPEKGDDHSNFAAFLTHLDTMDGIGPGDNPVADLYKMLDMNNAMVYFAVTSVMSDLDNLIGNMPQNLYLVDPVAEGEFQIIGWDHNHAYDGFPGCSCGYGSTWKSTIKAWEMCGLDMPILKQMFAYPLCTQEGCSDADIITEARRRLILIGKLVSHPHVHEYMMGQFNDMAVMLREAVVSVGDASLLSSFDAGTTFSSNPDSGSVVGQLQLRSLAVQAETRALLEEGRRLTTAEMFERDVVQASERQLQFGSGSSCVSHNYYDWNTYVKDETVPVYDAPEPPAVCEDMDYEFQVYGASGEVVSLADIDYDGGSAGTSDDGEVEGDGGSAMRRGEGVFLVVLMTVGWIAMVDDGI